MLPCPGLKFLGVFQLEQRSASSNTCQNSYKLETTAQRRTWIYLPRYRSLQGSSLFLEVFVLCCAAFFPPKLCQLGSVTANFSSCKQPLLPACLPCQSHFPLIWLHTGSMYWRLLQRNPSPSPQLNNPLEYGDDPAQAALQICL